MAMAEEGSGIYWFGTGSEGLSRYDGYKWVTFNIYNTGIINDDVNSIHKDASGNMWFGTNGGVSKYGDGSWTGYDNYNTNGSLPNDINVVKSDTNGNMWFGSNSSGAVFYDGWTWINYNTSNSGIADNRIYAEGVSSVGIWFGFGDSCYPTGCGTSYFDGINWTTFNTSNSGLPSNYVYSILEDSGTVWFGSDFGLTRFSDGNWTNYPMPSRVNSIDIDSYGNLWLGTENNGVCRFDAGTGICTWFNTYNSGIASNRVVYVFVDSYGRKWFGHGPDPGGVKKGF
jgi:ligand-binding sensor domain-containing protein